MLSEIRVGARYPTSDGKEPVTVDSVSEGAATRAPRRKRMTVPAALAVRIEAEAAAMMVPPEWVLRAAIDVALAHPDTHALVHAVEAVRDQPRVVRTPRYTRPREPDGDLPNFSIHPGKPEPLR